MLKGTTYTNTDEFEWADACAIVETWMADRSSWHAEVENFGWQKLNGEKEFEASTGADLLLAILPDTSCTFTLKIEDDKLLIENAHHDRPMGGEYYTVEAQE